MFSHYCQYHYHQHHHQPLVPKMGSGRLTSALHTSLSYAHLIACFSVYSSHFMSSVTQSLHLFLGLPLGLIPGTWCSQTSFKILASRRTTCPNHLSLDSSILSLMCLTDASLLMYSFVLCSKRLWLVTALKHPHFHSV